MIGVCPILYVGWKIWRKTKIIKPHEADLVWDRPAIDRYEASFKEEPLGFWEECGQMLGIKKKKPIDVEI